MKQLRPLALRGLKLLSVYQSPVSARALGIPNEIFEQLERDGLVLEVQGWGTLKKYVITDVGLTAFYRAKDQQNEVRVD